MLQSKYTSLTTIDTHSNSTYFSCPLRAFDRSDAVGAIVITGSEKAFAAGADIKEMSKRNYIECYTNNLFENWTHITKITKPTIAAGMPLNL